MKVVLDTNVLLSGLMFPEGTPGRIVAAWVDADLLRVPGEPHLHRAGHALAHAATSLLKPAACSQ